MLQGHTIKPKHGARKTSAAVGRGHGSGLGSGGRHRLAFFGSKGLIQSMPKLRGFKAVTAKAVTITLSQLQRAFADGTIITQEELFKADLIARLKLRVKIVGTTKIDKKFTINGIPASAGAKTAIEAAGGTVNI
jgi:large subunit ribosomal protein L15